jgi:DNA-binding NarL/FixJ family response regulator
MKPQARHSLVVCGAHPGHGESVAEELVSFGYDVRHCTDEESLITQAAEHRPCAIIYELQHQLPVDLAILALVRRVLPHVPFVVVAGALAEQAVRVLRAVHPMVLAHDPVDRSELRNAVRLAVRRSLIARRREQVLAGT